MCGLALACAERGWAADEMMNTATNTQTRNILCSELSSALAGQETSFAPRDIATTLRDLRGSRSLGSSPSARSPGAPTAPCTRRAGGRALRSRATRPLAALPQRQRSHPPSRRRQRLGRARAVQRPVTARAHARAYALPALQQAERMRSTSLALRSGGRLLHRPPKGNGRISTQRAMRPRQRNEKCLPARQEKQIGTIGISRSCRNSEPPGQGSSDRSLRTARTTRYLDSSAALLCYSCCCYTSVYNSTTRAFQRIMHF